MTLKDLVPKNLAEKLLPKRGGEQVDPLSLLHREVNRMFDDFSTGTSLASYFQRSPFQIFGKDMVDAWMPRVDVTETEDEIQATAELPGMDEKDVNIEILDNVLTISGEKKSESEDHGKNHHRSERSYGFFRRSLALSNEVDRDKAVAKFKKGVLTVTLPKRTQKLNNAKRINVKPE